ncbi:cell division protein FtsZ [Polynucleobacter sp. AP-Titi-500A-B4]|uniref:cell division protein FtsZ n=1 Tax=Polynucleobacter sp. AP-Titi-500A-B4 TaxID=2576923 RepID=UPI001BFCE7C8|nr:cell division protein FtsZ [Polynucleobacter sp. AP-Titi-500A-B4]QWE12676.1 cell division protein FtsZ [Polynucleobacter sp. AP-Titi-500A-B4]
MEFEMLDQEIAGKTIIKVVGVGGAGGNAVQHMIRRGVNGVEFICMNTDAGALQRSEASVNLQLGSSGLGAGAKPEIGAASAEEARARIADTLQGAHMVFITAGMGGGTGTGAAPIVAQVAKEMGILTVGVISKPFDFEGVKRLKVAENGAAELESYVDSLIVVLNEKLFEVMGEDAEFDKAFACADDVLHNAVSGIAEIINVQGLINVDFEDVKTVMGEQGKAMMGTATVSGMDRARLAAEAAVASPLLEGVDLSGARGVLVNITASRSLKLSETREVMAAIRGYAADDATVIFGTVYDESLGDALRVTVVATGLNNPQARKANQPEVVWRQATGTHDAMPTMADLNTFAPSSASAAISKVSLDSALNTSAGMALTGSGTAPAIATQPASTGVDYSQYDLPRVFRSSREATPAPTLGADSSPQAKTLLDKGADYYEIPAFLRKQAD